MCRFIVILLFSAISAGCFPKQAFRPGPAAFKSWVKSGANDDDVKAQMLGCGYSNPYYTDKRQSLNDRSKQEICMLNKKYKYKSGFTGTCYLQNWKTLPACVEYRKTHP